MVTVIFFDEAMILARSLESPLSFPFVPANYISDESAAYDVHAGVDDADSSAAWHTWPVLLFLKTILLRITFPSAEMTKRRTL